MGRVTVPAMPLGETHNPNSLLDWLWVVLAYGFASALVVSAAIAAVFAVHAAIQIVSERRGSKHAGRRSTNPSG